MRVDWKIISVTCSMIVAEVSGSSSQVRRHSMNFDIIFFPGVDLVYSYGAMHSYCCQYFVRDRPKDVLTCSAGAFLKGARRSRWSPAERIGTSFMGVLEGFWLKAGGG